MIIFVNGAQKSGSTWLMHIVLQLKPIEPTQLVEGRGAAAAGPTTVSARHLPHLLKDRRFVTDDRVIKSHFRHAGQRRMLLGSPQVRVVDIERDIRDVAVSFYYHRQKTQAFDGAFTDFYWQQRSKWVWPVLIHRAVWDIRSPRFLLLNYDALHSDFGGQVQRLADFLAVPLPDGGIEAIARATSPQAVNRQFQWGELNRFRKGVSGEWRTHFDQAMLADIANLQRCSRTLAFRLAVHSPQPLQPLLRRFRRCPPPLRRI